MAIDTHTSKSELVIGLYFAGEVITWWVRRGGYNLKGHFKLVMYLETGIRGLTR